MQYLYVVLPLVIMATIILITKKYGFKQIINAVFYGLLSAILVMVITSIFHLGTTVGTVTFLQTMLIAAIPEELSKFFCIKLANSKDKTRIFLNSILIAITFAVFENTLYMYSKGYSIGLSRTLAPGHFIFEIAMALFLIQALKSDGFKKAIYYILALLVPMLLHAGFNVLDANNIVMYVIGGLAYVFAIGYIIKLPGDKTPVRLFVLKFIGVLLIVLCTLILILSSGTTHKLNTDVEVTEENLVINVLSVDQTEDVLGKYYKVKVKFTNNGAKEFQVFPLKLSVANNMGEAKNATYANDVNDQDIDTYIVNSGTSETYIFYIKVDEFNYKYFVYHTNELNSTAYTFNLK